MRPRGGGQRREPAEQRRQGDLHLDARQLLAEALVDAVAERDVARGVPVQVERVGVGDRTAPVNGDLHQSAE